MVEQRHKKDKETLLQNLTERLSQKMEDTPLFVDSSQKDSNMVNSENIEQLIHYNNIVSGFLSLEGDDENIKRNLVSIKFELESRKELENSQGNKEESSFGKLIGIGDSKEYEKALEELASEDQSENESTTIETETLNKIYHYDIDDQ